MAMTMTIDPELVEFFEYLSPQSKFVVKGDTLLVYKPKGRWYEYQVMRVFKYSIYESEFIERVSSWLAEN
jgi:hypothetical protein